MLATRATLLSSLLFVVFERNAICVHIMQVRGGKHNEIEKFFSIPVVAVTKATGMKMLDLVRIHAEW
jgi:hypothetical protein